MKFRLVVSWILQLCIAGILGWGSFQKLVGDPDMVALFHTLEMGNVGRYLIAALEIVTVFLLLNPPSILFGSILGWGLMTGAMIAHVTRLGLWSQSMGFTVLVWLLCVAVLLLRKDDLPFVKFMFSRNPED